MRSSCKADEHLNQDELQIFSDISPILNLQPNIFRDAPPPPDLVSLFRSVVFVQYDPTIEQSAPAAAPGTVYRFYVEANDPSDRLIEIFGNAEAPLVISTPAGIFNSVLNASWNASGINEALFGFFPDLQDDSFASCNDEDVQAFGFASCC